MTLMTAAVKNDREYGYCFGITDFSVILNINSSHYSTIIIYSSDIKYETAANSLRKQALSFELSIVYI